MRLNTWCLNRLSLEKRDITKRQALFGLIGRITTVVGFLAKTVYRDYIYLNSIDDFGLADVLPSYLYVIGFSLLLLMRLDRMACTTIAVVTSASIAFEFWQYRSSGSFDVPDTVASLAGGLSSFLIFKLVCSTNRMSHASRANTENAAE